MASNYPVSLENTSLNIEYADEVTKLCDEAKQYLNGFKWCKIIRRSFLYYNLGKILCIFLFEIENTQSKEDDRIWVIVGDLPKMYLDTFGPRSVKEVLEDYSDLANEWAENVLQKKSLSNCFPFNEAPSAKLAKMLKSRVGFIRTNLLTNIQDVDLL